MYWSLKTIIAFLSAICYISASTPQNVTLSSNVTRRIDPASHRQYFVRSLQALSRLSNGIFVQSELPEQYLNITAQFIGYDPDGLSALHELYPFINQTASDIKTLIQNLTALNLTNHFGNLSQVGDLLRQVVGVSHRLGLVPKKDHIQAYLSTKTSVESANYNYEFMNFAQIFRLEKCLTHDLKVLRAENCQEILPNIVNITADIVSQVNQLKDSSISFPNLHRLSNQLGRINQILFTVVVAEFISKPDYLNSIGSRLDETESDLKKLAPILSGLPSFDKLDAIRELLSTFTGEKRNSLIPAFSHGIRGLDHLFADIEQNSMKYSISGGKSLEGLKKGLTPLKSYKAQLPEIEKGSKLLQMKAVWMKNYTVLERLKYRLDMLKQWKSSGVYSLPRAFVDPIKTCVNNVTKPTSPLNMTEIRKIGAYFTRLNKQIVILADAVNNITNSRVAVSLNKTALIVAEKMKDVNFDDDKALSDAMKHTMSKLRLLKVLDSLLQPFEPSKDYNSSALVTLLNEHPDLKPLEDSLDYIDFNSLITKVRCLSDNGYTYQSDVVLFGNNLTVLVDRWWIVNASTMFLEDVSVVLDLIKKGEKIPMAKSKEIEQINLFGKAKDVTLPLVKAWPQFEKISKTIDELKLFQDAVVFKDGDNSTFWKRWTETGKLSVEKMIKQLRELDGYVTNNTNQGLGAMAKVLDRASKIEGVHFDWQGLEVASPEIQNVFKNISELDLKFSSHSRHLGEAAVRISIMKTFFDDFFGIKPQETAKLQRVVEQKFPVLMVVLMIAGSLFAFLFLTCIVYSLTCGRNRWKKYFLEHFASPETIELYWRYSYWRDQESEKNELCEAVREINYDQVKALIHAGAYINVYNSFGNTPLHAATKYGHAKIVEVLIKNGADRFAFNFENKIPEQLVKECLTMYVKPICSNSEKSGTERKTPDQIKIEKLYQKHRLTKFRTRIPDLLPTMDFRIRIDTKIKNKTVDEFIEFYKGNVTDQVAGVTHLIVPTGKDGIFVSDDFAYIMCVFLPTLMMQEQWMRACLEKKSNFRDDYKFRVEKVRYKGKEYGTVLKWAQWIHKQTLPYLFGVQLHLCAEVGESVGSQLRQLVEMHGATWCEEVPIKEQYNVGSHPFHHFHLGPLFVIHSNNVPSMEHLKNDELYTLMTFDEFIIFMLQMDVKYDLMRRLPIPVTAEPSGLGPAVDEASVNASSNLVSNASSTNLTSNASSTNLASSHK